MQNEEDIIVTDIDTTINADETENNVEGEEVAPHDEMDTLKKTIATLEAQKEHWRKKASTAPQAVNQTQSGMSPMDIAALSKIDEDDMETVMDWAKYKGTSISEALKSNEMKATLSLKEEMRKSASVANTGSTRRANSSVSDSQLLSNAKKGVMPDSDDDLNRLVRLQRASK